MEDETRADHIASPHFLYGLPLTHKHVPEMQQHGLLDHAPLFSPSVGRFPQGMIVQIPLFRHLLKDGANLQFVHAALADHYAGQSVVEVVSLDVSASLPRIDVAELAGKDTMKLFVFGQKDGDQINIVALLDNLGKGASGAAVQNMDLMLAG
jgi:N-acetyl-gamma-glutamyl-phosphate reductase